MPSNPKPSSHADHKEGFFYRIAMSIEWPCINQKGQPLLCGSLAATHRPRNDMSRVERIALVLVDVDQGGPNRVLRNRGVRVPEWLGRSSPISVDPRVIH